MIEILYRYRDANGEWHDAAKTFYNIEKAIRFCYVIKNKSNMYLEGWRCDTIEENEYIDSRVNLAKFNRKGGY